MDTRKVYCLMHIVTGCKKNNEKCRKSVSRLVYDFCWLICLSLIGLFWLNRPELMYLSLHLEDIFLSVRHLSLSPSLLVTRWFRLWRTTIRRCCPCTGTTVFTAWSRRTQSSLYAMFQPTSVHTLSSSPGMARTWPLTSTCCLRPPGSLASRLSTCQCLLLCLVCMFLSTQYGSRLACITCTWCLSNPTLLA